MAPFVAPSASDGREVHADWLELRALEAADRNSSIQDLVQAIRRAGTIEEIGIDDEDEGLPDRSAEKIEVVAGDAFAAIETRPAACGGGGAGGAYPFCVGSQYIELTVDPKESLYLFLLLLGYFGKDAGPDDSDGAQLFELVCVHAAAAYFGGEGSGVGSYHFGAPRRSTPAGFKAALDDMCRRMGEGGGCRRDRSSVRHQKDGKLDLIVWRPFPDGRAGQIIGFGQCATGADWADKLSHLQPEAFCGQWMLDTPVVTPVKLFFLPFRIEEERWPGAARAGGIVLDRCRIAAHGRGLDRALLDKCAVWTGHVLREQLGS